MSTRVLWVVKGLGRGGAERLLTLVAERLDRERFAIDVAYLLPGKADFAQELEDHGLSVYCLHARSPIGPRWVGRLRTLLAQGYSIVHTHSPLPATAARIVVRRPTRIVHTEHNLWTSYRRPTRLANALTYGRNDAVIAVSDAVAESIQPPRWSVGNAPVPEVLLHGVDPENAPYGAHARSEARTLLGLDPATPVVGTVANLSAKKDHATLVAAIDRVRHRVPGVVLLLIGDGPLRATLESDVARRGLKGTVRFLGSRDDVTDLLPALDLFVLSSRYEGLPIALLEAMAAGVACVSTEVGGIPEALRGGTEGRLVPPGDADALADAMTGVLQDPAVRAALGTAGRGRVREQFSVDRAVRRTETIYTELLTDALGRAPADPPAPSYQAGDKGELE